MNNNIIKLKGGKDVPNTNLQKQNNSSLTNNQELPFGIKIGATPAQFAQNAVKVAGKVGLGTVRAYIGNWYDRLRGAYNWAKNQLNKPVVPKKKKKVVVKGNSTSPGKGQFNHGNGGGDFYGGGGAGGSWEEEQPNNGARNKRKSLVSTLANAIPTGSSQVNSGRQPQRLAPRSKRRRSTITTVAEPEPLTRIQPIPVTSTLSPMELPQPTIDIDTSGLQPVDIRQKVNRRFVRNWMRNNMPDNPDTLANESNPYNYSGVLRRAIRRYVNQDPKLKDYDKMMLRLMGFNVL